MILNALTDNHVDYVLVGDVAGSAWGSPTVADVMALTYDRAAENVERLCAALESLDAAFDAETLRRGLNFTFTTRAGDVDVLGQPAGVDGWAELAPNAVPMEIGGVTVPVADLDDLIRMKLAAGRPKDRIEVEILAAVRDEREAQGRTEP